MRVAPLFCSALLVLLSIVSAVPSSENYIIGLSNPVTSDKIKQAKLDVQKAGGKILSEVTLGFHGLIVSLPLDSVQLLQAKDYIEFIEQDTAVHASV